MVPVSRMRLFVALELLESAKAALATCCSGLKDVRWIQPSNMHLTLKFIGEVEAAQAEKIKQALGAVRAAPFAFSLSGVGHFPPRGKPRVLWAGVKAPPALATLAGAVEAALIPFGLPRDEHAFSPHITLARLKYPPSAEALRGWLEGHADFKTEPLTVNGFVLFSSTLTSAGAVYRKEAVIPLTQV